MAQDFALAAHRIDNFIAQRRNYLFGVRTTNIEQIKIEPMSRSI
jgi:hypothetical protein